MGVRNFRYANALLTNAIAALQWHQGSGLSHLLTYRPTGYENLTHALG